MSKWKTWRTGSFSFSGKCPLCTVPLQRNSTENWFCHGSASLRALARWRSYSQVGDSLSDGELHWWNGSMICNKTWIAGLLCLTSLGTITIIFLIQSDQVFVTLVTVINILSIQTRKPSSLRCHTFLRRAHWGFVWQPHFHCWGDEEAVTDCSERCFHCRGEYFGLLCSPQSQEKGVNTHLPL